MKARQYGYSAVAFICVIVMVLGVRVAAGTPESHAVQVSSTPPYSGPHLGSGLAVAAASKAGVVEIKNRKIWYAAVWKDAVTRNNFVRWIVYAYEHRPVAPRAPPRVVSSPIASASQNVSPTPTVSLGSLSGVAQCIKDHESGNYSESSHPGSGSGAYQFIPGTWQTWSARAGYGGYTYAYQAPPAVQDAVLQYTLTHGGAGNWSPRYGDDPCTVGMGG